MAHKVVSKSWIPVDTQLHEGRHRLCRGQITRRQRLKKGLAVESCGAFRIVVQQALNVSAGQPVSSLLEALDLKAASTEECPRGSLLASELPLVIGASARSLKLIAFMVDGMGCDFTKAAERVKRSRDDRIRPG